VAAKFAMIEQVRRLGADLTRALSVNLIVLNQEREPACVPGPCKLPTVACPNGQCYLRERRTPRDLTNCPPLIGRIRETAGTKSGVVAWQRVVKRYRWIGAGNADRKNGPLWNSITPATSQHRKRRPLHRAVQQRLPLAKREFIQEGAQESIPACVPTSRSRCQDCMSRP